MFHFLKGLTVRSKSGILVNMFISLKDKWTASVINYKREKIRHNVRGLEMYVVISTPLFNQWEIYLDNLVEQGLFELTNQWRDIIAVCFAEHRTHSLLPDFAVDWRDLQSLHTPTSTLEIQTYETSTYRIFKWHY
jgi:hypothetical protein